MHILVVNDDGPPSTTSSPYVLDLVWHLRSRGHQVSVVLPDVQRSWISKAHIVGQTIKPTYYQPPAKPASWHAQPSTSTDAKGAVLTDLSYVDQGSVHQRPFVLSQAPQDQEGNSEGKKEDQDEWILVNSTPATCVQIGLYHHPQLARFGKFDLVISGPNYGRNTTAVFALSSGTLGGALEAAVCNVRAIALSYAFFERNHDPVVVTGATIAAVDVVESLVGRWSAEDLSFGAAASGAADSSQARKTRVQVFSVNVPLKEGVRNAKAVWTRMLLNTWSSGSCFEQVEAVDEGPETEEEKNRAREVAVERLNASGAEVEKQEKQSSDVNDDGGREPLARHRHFKWAPKFGDVYKSVRDAPPGNDGWAVEKGLISVTPLLANFMQVEGFEGDVDR